jgi:hypothetical protein
VLFADDTSIIITNTNVQEYKHNIKITIQEINDCEPSGTFPNPTRLGGDTRWLSEGWHTTSPAIF